MPAHWSDSKTTFETRCVKTKKRTTFWLRNRIFRSRSHCKHLDSKLAVIVPLRHCRLKFTHEGSKILHVSATTEWFVPRGNWDFLSHCRSREVSVQFQGFLDFTSFISSKKASYEPPLKCASALWDWVQVCPLPQGVINIFPQNNRRLNCCNDVWENPRNRFRFVKAEILGIF